MINETNNKNSSLKKINTNYQKDFTSSSSTQNLNNLTTKKNIKNKRNRNCSMTNRIIKIKDKNCITNIISNNYNTNNNENTQDKNLNRSVMISGDKKITLDTLMDEAKKRYNKKKYDNSNKNILTNEDDNMNNSNKKKLQQFYEEHLNKINNKNINIMNNKRNISDNNESYNNNLEIYKSYDYPEKNNQKNFNYKIDSKEKVKNYDKFNINQLIQNDNKKKENKK